MANVFTKIIRGEIPSVTLFQDELCTVILDIAPVNKGHMLVISNEVYPTLETCPLSTLSHMMSVVQACDTKLRETLKADAVNIVINDGPAAGQEIPHLHIHVIPRYDDDEKRLSFPKESYKEGEIQQYGEKLSITL
ncbi:MAG: HIT family protein [Sphaerochaetaceae bacterium]|jgi:histidine triad (HIT) family protein